MSDHGFLSAMSRAFKGEAARWFRMEREHMRSWKKFAKMFKDRYVGEYDQQDLYDDLRRRTQGKGEKVERFLLNFKYIVSRFKKPSTAVTFPRPQPRKCMYLALRSPGCKRAQKLV